MNINQDWVTTDSRNKVAVLKLVSTDVANQLWSRIGSGVVNQVWASVGWQVGRTIVVKYWR